MTDTVTQRRADVVLESGVAFALHVKTLLITLHQSHTGKHYLIEHLLGKVNNRTEKLFIITHKFSRKIQALH